MSTPSVPPARHAPFFQAGFAYSHIGGSYDSDVSSLELGKMRAAGGNTVQFIAFAYVYRLDAPGIGMAPERWDQVLRGGISRAKAAGLRAMVKLQTWGPGFQDGKFSADIAMTNAADWRAFMANYRRYVLRYARLAAETDADILCVGTEIWSPAGATHEMRIAPVAAASACAHAAPERDRSGCGAALSGLALTTRFFPGLTPWAVLFRPFGAPHYPNRRVGSRNLDIVASLHYCITMRTTVTLDDDVFQAAQSLAKASGKRLGQVLSELIRRALHSESRGFTRQGGLPVFSVRPDAEVIPASRAAELLANEPK